MLLAFGLLQREGGRCAAHGSLRHTEVARGPEFIPRQLEGGGKASEVIGGQSIHTSMSTFGRLLKVPNRRYIDVTGKDAIKFLQGIMTNDATRLQRYGDALACVFLTPKGRVLADALLYSLGKHRVLVEVHDSVHAPLLRHMSVHKLRSSVTISPATENYCCFVQRFLPSTKTEGIVLSGPDPRGPEFGTRILTLQDPVADEVAASVEYERFRLLKGLPDTPEIVGRIPLECNLDLLNYISFTKGCYVGQELVSRTKFRGLLRKRVLPYIVLSHVDSKGCDGASRGNEEIEIKIPESLGEWSGVGVGMFPFAQPSVPPKKIDKAQETVVRSNFVNKVVLTFQPDLFLKTL